MSFQKRFITIILFVIFSCIIKSSVEARSVYAIPKHDWGDKLNLYDVTDGQQEGQLEYRASYNLPSNISANDITIDTLSDIMFVTSETSRILRLINAKSFLSEGYVEAIGAYDLAGVLIHHVGPGTTVLYTVDRGTNKLFMYDWDAGAKELTPLPYSDSQPWYELQPYDENDPCVFACGLALDEINGTIYVSQLKRIDPSYFTYSNIVYAYDPNVSAPNPNDRFRCTRKIDLGQHEGKDNYAVDIDIDSSNGWLYAGGFNIADKSHDNLIRYDLIDEPGSPGDDGHIQDIGAGVIGLSVSPGTSYVYMTTFNQQLEAWDTDTWAKIDAEDIGNGAGVCVAQEGYLPPFAVEKVDNVDGFTSPHGQEIEYTISVDYQWDGHEDPDIIDSIEIVDYLPREVDFDRAQPDTGQYKYDDPNGGWYTWIITDANLFEETQSFKLIVESQNERMTPGYIIENYVEVTATVNEGEHKSWFTLQTCVCYDTDFDTDGIVSYPDFAIFANAWLSDPCDGNWNSYCDLVTDNIIDIDDLKDFATEWLWIACDPMEGMPLMGGGGGMDGMSGSESIPASEDTAQPEESSTPYEPSVEEQIEQIKSLLDRLDEIKDEVDEDTWLDLTSTLEEMLKELQDLQ